MYAMASRTEATSQWPLQGLTVAKDRALVNSNTWCAQQEPEQRRGPHRAAMAEAARAAAVKPMQRVLFKAACRVDAPQRPGLDKPVQPILGRRRAPAKKEDSEVDVEVGTASIAPIEFFSALGRAPPAVSIRHQGFTAVAFTWPAH